MKKLIIALVLLGGVVAFAYASLSNRKDNKQATEKKAEKKKECKKHCMFS